MRVGYERLTFIHSQIAKLDHFCILIIETGTTISDKSWDKSWDTMHQASSLLPLNYNVDNAIGGFSGEDLN